MLLFIVLPQREAASVNHSRVRGNGPRLNAASHIIVVYRAPLASIYSPQSQTTRVEEGWTQREAAFHRGTSTHTRQVRRHVGSPNPARHRREPEPPNRDEEMCFRASRQILTAPRCNPPPPLLQPDTHEQAIQGNRDVGVVDTKQRLIARRTVRSDPLGRYL